MSLLTQRYSDKISGQLQCYDRIVIHGTLPGICYAQGMTSYLYAHGIRIFDYPRFAEPLRNQLRDNAEQIAKDNGLQIQFITWILHENQRNEHFAAILYFCCSISWLI